MDRVITPPWRGVVSFNLGWLGVAMASKGSGNERSDFSWRRGKDLVIVSRVGGSWQVACLTQGRLLGPRTCIYQGLHKQAKYAAWDVMAKVINASHDEEEGIQAARDAAQWMKREEASGRSTSDA